MNTQANIRQMVKTIKVRKLGELIRFQVRHPENAQALIGISTTCSQNEPLVPTLCGQLELFIPDLGDLAFTEELRFDGNQYRDLVERAINLPPTPGTFGWNGSSQSMFRTQFRIRQAMMEGIYQDLTQESPDGLRFNTYTINLYLQYELSNTPNP